MGRGFSWRVGWWAFQHPFPHPFSHPLRIRFGVCCIPGCVCFGMVSPEI